jgi:hypothetical protein
MINQVEAALTGDFAIVRDIVRQHTGEFITHGFELVNVTLVPGSSKIQTSPVFEFLNRRTGMTIRISFSAAHDGLNGGFGVRIIKPVRRRLNVEDYLKLHGRGGLTKYFRYRDPKTDVRSFAESFLQMLSGLLDEDLKPILDGKTFEETPIDWMGYK